MEKTLKCWYSQSSVRTAMCACLSAGMLQDYVDHSLVNVFSKYIWIKKHKHVRTLQSTLTVFTPNTCWIFHNLHTLYNSHKSDVTYRKSLLCALWVGGTLAYKKVHGGKVTVTPQQQRGTNISFVLVHLSLQLFISTRSFPTDQQQQQQQLRGDSSHHLFFHSSQKRTKRGISACCRESAHVQRPLPHGKCSPVDGNSSLCYFLFFSTPMLLRFSVRPGLIKL